jgi:hypothetical protein
VTSTPAEPLLSIVATLGDMAALGTSATTTVPANMFMQLLGGYTSLLGLAKKA